MESIFQSLVLKTFSILAHAIAPLFRTRLAKLLRKVSGDIPQVSGAWVIEYQEPDHDNTTCASLIDAKLEQFGTFVIGTGHVQGFPGDPFRYEAVIKRNAMYGTFKRKDSDVLAGTGTFVLKVAADLKTMQGHCSWYDSGLDGVWRSHFLWHRSGQLNVSDRRPLT